MTVFLPTPLAAFERSKSATRSVSSVRGMGAALERVSLEPAHWRCPQACWLGVHYAQRLDIRPGYEGKGFLHPLHPMYPSLLHHPCDVGGDEAAADNRRAHRPLPTVIVIHCCTPPRRSLFAAMVEVLEPQLLKHPIFGSDTQKMGVISLYFA